MINHSYGAACWRNSYHWNARQSATLSTTVVTNLTASDYLKARMQHWLGDSNNVNQTELLSVEQEPSSDGITAGQLTFYDYYGKTLPYLQGKNSQIAVTARVQPSGLAEYDWKQYNSAGLVTKDISTYTAANGSISTRTNSFAYATNTISFILNNSLVYGTPYSTNHYIIGGIYTPQYADATYNLTNTSFNCGAWSYNSGAAGVSTVAYPNILTSFTDASGATTAYGGFTQASQTIQNNYPIIQQSVVNTYTIPLPTRITNAAGYVSTITYNANNRITSIKSFSGLTTTNAYYSNGFLHSTVDVQLGRTNTFTWTNGLINTWLNERGLAETYSWDQLNRLTTLSDSAGVISNVYTRLDLTATRNKLGQWAYFGYDPLQNLIAATNFNNEVKLAAYCSCGALEWTRDAITNYTQYTYDLAGRLTSVQYPDGYTINNTYNSLDQLVQSFDALGYITNSYNLQGGIVSSANAVGIISAKSFDVVDRPLSATDNRGIATIYSFDSLGRVLASIVGGRLTNTFAYSNMGLIQFTDGLGNATTFQNDQLGRHLIQTNANGEVTQFKYDPSGNIVQLVDAKLQNTYFQFDSFNRLTNKLDNNQASVLLLTYDANNQVLTRLTPQKGTTTFTRDPMGRILTESFPMNPQVSFTYDPNGRRTNMVDGLGTTISTYSPAGQLQTEGGLWANDMVGLTYNNRLRASLSIGNLNTIYGYDVAHRLNQMVSGNGAYSYTYHPGFGGNYASLLIQSLSLPNTMAVTNGFDSVGRLTATALLNSGNAIFDSEQYSYDAASRVVSLTRFTNNVVAYSYDKTGQIKTATGKEANGTTRLNEQLGYLYDSAGNLVTRTNNLLTTTFGVNSLNELSNGTFSGALTAAGSTTSYATNVTVNGTGANLYSDHA